MFVTNGGRSLERKEGKLGLVFGLLHIDVTLLLNCRLSSLNT